MSIIRKAVLPAAGLGTRCLPATKAVPKELLPIVGTPVLQLLVEEAVAAGVTEIIFIVGSGVDTIRRHFSPNLPLEKKLAQSGRTDLLERVQRINRLAKFSFVEQREPLGDGHAILQARALIGDEPFLVLFGDELIVTESGAGAASELIAAFQQNSATVVALQKVAHSEVSRYGIVKPKTTRGTLVEIESFVEKPDPVDSPSDLALIGKYVCLPEIFEILAQRPNQSGEIRLIDALSQLVKTQPVFGQICAGTRYDTGDHFGLLQANIDFALRDPKLADRVKQYLKKIVSRF